LVKGRKGNILRSLVCREKVKYSMAEEWFDNNCNNRTVILLQGTAVRSSNLIYPGGGSFHRRDVGTLHLPLSPGIPFPDCGRHLTFPDRDKTKITVEPGQVF
jgi:hypothetical protein